MKGQSRKKGAKSRSRKKRQHRAAFFVCAGILLVLLACAGGALWILGGCPEGGLLSHSGFLQEDGAASGIWSFLPWGHAARGGKQDHNASADTDYGMNGSAEDTDDSGSADAGMQNVRTAEEIESLRAMEAQQKAEQESLRAEAEARAEAERQEQESEAKRIAIEERKAGLLAQGYLPIRQAQEDEITLRFAGDILFDSSYAIMASMLQRSSGGTPDIYTAFDSGLMELMRGADIFMVNNEFPYSDRGTPLPNKQFTFRARPAYASLLHDIGADVVALANNHVNDYGREAMLDTFSTLDSIGMPYAGAGHDLEEAMKPVCFTNGEVRIAILCTTQIERMGNPDTVGATETSPGVYRCLYSMDRLTAQIRELKEENDFVIVYIHWGTEGTETIDDWQKKQGNQIADAGADLIIGDHPHVLQRLDRIGSAQDTPVIYSLGNYLFNSKTLDTCLFSVTLDAHDASFREIRFIPAIQSGCRTKLATGAEAVRILRHMQEMSPNIRLTDEGLVTLP